MVSKIKKEPKSTGKLHRGELSEDIFKYYSVIKSKPKLYLEASSVQDNRLLLTVTNLIVLFIYERYNLQELIDLIILTVPLPLKNDTPEIYVKFESETFNTSSIQILDIEHLSKSTIQDFHLDIFSCKRPLVLINEKRLLISGLCSVLRFLFKYVISIREVCSNEKNEIEKVLEMTNLLGFKGGCLHAPAEISTWATFCEIDISQRMINNLVDLISNISNAEEQKDLNLEFELPKDLQRFENHLGQPVRIHNFRKRAQVMAKELNISIKSKENSVIKAELPHLFAEGPDILLSDLIIYPCVKLSLNSLGAQLIEKFFPKIFNWTLRVESFLKTPLNVQLPNNYFLQMNEFFNSKIKIPLVLNESLYKSDPGREESKQIYTKQCEIEAALEICSQITPFEPQVDLMGEMSPLLDWAKVLPIAHPFEGGKLPEGRQERKCDQLANLVQMVFFICKKREVSGQRVRIVDFCSGGGHLGILLASLLPNSDVKLVENKEESLRRAQARIEILGLSNISCVQSNLTRFVGCFDIGVALHACGTATDLVLQKCLDSTASFVISPCCYGAIHTNSVVSYPRSQKFRNISSLSLRHYFVLSHAADQTEVKICKKEQGEMCMRLVDTDRLLAFKEKGWDVWLRKMVPEEASTKNHILIGIPNA